jgi:hypothetical protein
MMVLVPQVRTWFEVHIYNTSRNEKGTESSHRRIFGPFIVSLLLSMITREAIVYSFRIVEISSRSNTSAVD